MPSTCKLCLSFAASQLSTAAERELAGSDTFTRDPDICDACLSEDYAQRPIFGVVEQFCLTAGWVVALLAAGPLVAWGVVPVIRSKPVTFVIVATTGALIASVLVWSIVQLAAWIRTRSAPTDPREREVEAERFYWLAIWASLTGRRRFKRRMLRRLKAMGLDDPARLSDRRLAGRPNVS